MQAYMQAYMQAEHGCVEPAAAAGQQVARGAWAAARASETQPQHLTQQRAGCSWRCQQQQPLCCKCGRPMGLSALRCLYNPARLARAGTARLVLALGTSATVLWKQQQPSSRGLLAHSTCIHTCVHACMHACRAAGGSPRAAAFLCMGPRARPKPLRRGPTTLTIPSPCRAAPSPPPLQELAHQDIVRQLKLEHAKEITKLRQEFELQARELQQKYEKKMKMLRDDLELRRKQEIHEIEERKNTHINELMKKHERAFAEIKNYYNDITHNNLDLIKVRVRGAQGGGSAGRLHGALGAHRAGDTPGMHAHSHVPGTLSSKSA